MADGKVEVVVKGTDAEHEVKVTVSARSTLLEVKAAVAKAIDRGEVMQGRFLMIMPNGDRKPIVETQRLGPRRTLAFDGCPLCPKPAEKPILSLEDYDPYDDECIIESPRTLKACEIEGVDPEELFHVPLKEHLQPGLPRRLARLRHDFFEAYRLDTVEIVRKSRYTVVDGGSSSSFGASITGFGGNWGGEMAPHQYPMTHNFFEALRGVLSTDKIYERPMSLKNKPACATRWTPGGQTKWEVDPDKPPHILMYLTSKDADVDQDVVDWACEDCEDNLKQLLTLPAGHGEQVIGLPKRSQNLVNAQIPGDRKVLKRLHRDKKDVLKRQVAVAEAQVDNVDWMIEDVRVASTARQERFRQSLAPKESELQRKNAEFPAKREEYWRGRREAVHQAQLDAEDARNEKLRTQGAKVSDRESRVANMRALTQVHFARTWTDRRSNWGRNHLAVNKGTDAYNAGILHKHKEAEARVEDQRKRMQSLIDFRREFKELRKALTDMAAERERKRQAGRRKAVSDEFLRMAEDASADWAASTSPAGFMASSRSLGAFTMGMTPTARSVASSASPGSKRGPRFDWGRFGAEALSPMSTQTTSRMRRTSSDRMHLTVRTMASTAASRFINS